MHHRSLTKAILLSAGILALLAPCLLSTHPVARLEPFVSGLARPVSIRNAGDGSGRLFILEIEGRIRVIRDGELLPEPFLDISDQVVREGEGGLLGLAFHPDFERNGRFFTLHTTSGADEQISMVISEFRASEEDPDRASPDQKVVVRMARPTSIHHAGDMAFGPDGFLYISSGDGGPPGDPDDQGQNLGTRLGAILRIDVSDPENPYAIPPDNPFLGVEGARGEIWAYGLRNPFRMAFDPLTGRLFAGDVGAARFEEVNIIVKGGNYGWSILEGTECFPSSVASCEREGLIPPIHQYGRGRDPGAPIAVIGGRVYRGSQPTPLWGSYIFADFAQPRIWALRETGGGLWTRREIAHTGFLLSAFGEDEGGELYVADILGGNIFRIRFAWKEIFTQVADGPSPAGIFRSRIVLVNNGDRTASGTLRFFAPDGQPLEMTFGGVAHVEFPLSLPPHSSRSFPTPGTSEPLKAGWAEAETDFPVSGSVLYTVSDPASPEVHQAGVSGSVPGTDFTAEVRRNAASQSTVAVAAANPSPVEEARVRVVIRSAGGEALVDEEVILGPRWRGAAFIEEFGQLPQDFEGTLRLTSDREIAPTLLLTAGQLPAASLPARR